MFISRFQLGSWLFATVRTVDAASTPVVPTNPPTIKVWSSSAVVLTAEMPVVDRYSLTGLFTYPVFLGSAYAAGQYTITYHWVTGSYIGFADDNFEILPGGNSGGQNLSSYFFSRPHADFIVSQLETGVLVAGRNPRVNSTPSGTGSEITTGGFQEGP